MPYDRQKALVLTTNWQLELAVATSTEPIELLRLLQSLIIATLRNLIPETATRADIALAKDYLKKGIILQDKFYTVALYTPTDTVHRRTFLCLVKTYPDGKLTFLNDGEI